MAKPLSALILVTECTCIRCGSAWRESSFLYRSESGYNWDDTDEKIEGLASGHISISGRRVSHQRRGACHRCCTGPDVTIWPVECKADFDDDLAITDRQIRKPKVAKKSSAEAQAEIDALFNP